MKVSTRNQTDFSIKQVTIHDQLPNFMAVVFNDNKSRCELYNIESEILKDREGAKLRRINSVMHQDDSSILDNLLLGPK